MCQSCHLNVGLCIQLLKISVQIKNNIPQCALWFVLKIFQDYKCVLERRQDSALDLRGD